MTRREASEIIERLEDLLDIARLAMPDTYYESDRRVKRAKKLIETLKYTAYV